MKRHFFKSILFFFVILVTTSLKGQDKIDLLIQKMSVEQKVGQMTQINLGFLSSSIDQHDGKVKQIDNEKLENAILKYHVGSILNTAGTAY